MEISDTKIAIGGVLGITTLVTFVIVQTGTGIDQIDAVFGLAIGAIAGLASK